MGQLDYEQFFRRPGGFDVTTFDARAFAERFGESVKDAVSGALHIRNNAPNGDPTQLTEDRRAEHEDYVEILRLAGVDFSKLVEARDVLSLEE